MSTLAFDLVLGAALVATAVGALFSRELFRGVVLFVVFGLLMALAWVRLQAPDLALAEAAIGAGLTGALLLDAIGHLKRRRALSASGDRAPGDRGPVDRISGDSASDHRASGSSTPDEVAE